MGNSPPIVALRVHTPKSLGNYMLTTSSTLAMILMSFPVVWLHRKMLPTCIINILSPHKNFQKIESASLANLSRKCYIPKQKCPTKFSVGKIAGFYLSPSFQILNIKKLTQSNQLTNINIVFELLQCIATNVVLLCIVFADRSQHVIFLNNRAISRAFIKSQCMVTYWMKI